MQIQDIKGTNPQFLVEKIIRNRILESLYWKEHCFGLTAETLLDKAIELSHVGGQYSNQKPTNFLCLLLKLLQLQPEQEIILFYIQQEKFKYFFINKKIFKCSRSVLFSLSIKIN